MLFLSSAQSHYEGAEGGMLTTSNAEIDRKLRLCRQHGMSVPDNVRYGSQQMIFEDYLLIGFNYRMTDVQAAVGRKRLERLPGLVARRRFLADRYALLLGDVEGLGFEPDWVRSNWPSCCVRLPDWVNQKAIMQASRPIQAISKRHDLRLSEDVRDHSILLPLSAQMTQDELVRVADALRLELNR
jgi:dTDP-4-amino-4,6-dideoxygalactose transaminase